MSELISIIVPVYNVSRYLDRCLKSLIGQSYDDIEIVLVDDSSTDGSGEICDKYGAEYENIVVVHKENDGLGYARNSGLDVAQGKYIAFVDSDDYVSKDYINHLYSEMKIENVDFCKSGFIRIDAEGRIESTTRYINCVYQGRDATDKLVPLIVGPAPDKYDLIEMSVCAVLYKSSIIKDHNLRFNSEKELISEDMVFNIDYLQYANGACTIDALDYNYMMNDASLTHRYRPDRGKAVIYFYNTVKSKLLDLGYDNDTIIRLSRVFFIYIRMSIAQERRKVSSNSCKNSRKIINELCSDDTVNRAIAEYPVRRLELKRRIFLFLVKNRCAGMLLLFANMGML